MRHSSIFTITLIAISIATAWGQQEVRIGLGDSFISEDFPEGRSYHVWLVSTGYAWRLFELGKAASVYGMVDMQYGDASTLSHGEYDFDLAANLTLEMHWQFQKSIAFIASIGSGPGYQSSVSIVQARGFIFSNNFAAGLRISVAKGTMALCPQVRFRHMSNAALKSPNQGIDNFLLMVGVAIPVSKKQ